MALEKTTGFQAKWENETKERFKEVPEDSQEKARQIINNNPKKLLPGSFAKIDERTCRGEYVEVIHFPLNKRHYIYHLKFLKPIIPDVVPYDIVSARIIKATAQFFDFGMTVDGKYNVDVRIFQPTEFNEIEKGKISSGIMSKVGGHKLDAFTIRVKNILSMPFGLRMATSDELFKKLCNIDGWKKESVTEIMS